MTGYLEKNQRINTEPCLEIPFDVISCSWPRPVEQRDGGWMSEPDWDAPLMTMPPQPHWELIHDDLCWTINWRENFRRGLKLWEPHNSGEMRGFHIVFSLKIKASGRLVFWDEDGSVIRRNGRIIHFDNSAHPLTRNEIEVSESDVLEVAQWQLIGGWLWGAKLDSSRGIYSSTIDLLLSYLGLVNERLRHPSGPALKIYTNGNSPIRTAVSIYSMILNGYSPNRVLLFGENDWSKEARKIFTVALPFAQIIPADDVIRHIRSYGSYRLAEMAMSHWFVMKTCISLLYPPEEFCMMDDDIFILDDVNDALQAFRQYDLVFAPDADYSTKYLVKWGWMHGRKEHINTGVFNAGLYWIRNLDNPRNLAAYMLRVRPNTYDPPLLWEQGFIANLYAYKKTHQLSTQRYFFPMFDGLPGGTYGYDYALNPCDFASVHFGGMPEKPSDSVMPYFIHQILGRCKKIKI